MDDVYQLDEATELRNRRLFAAIGGGLALLIVVVGLLLLSLSHANTGAAVPRAATPVVTPLG
jgi:hypothetical protein